MGGNIVVFNSIGLKFGAEPTATVLSSMPIEPQRGPLICGYVFINLIRYNWKLGSSWNFSLNTRNPDFYLPLPCFRVPMPQIKHKNIRSENPVHFHRIGWNFSFQPFTPPSWIVLWEKIIYSLSQRPPCFHCFYYFRIMNFGQVLKFNLFDSRC